MAKTMKPNEGFLPEAEAPEVALATQAPEATQAHVNPVNNRKPPVKIEDLQFERATESEFDEFFTFENDGDQITGVVMGVSENPKVEGYLIDTLNGGVLCIPVYSAISKVIEEYEGELSKTVWRFTRLNKSKISGSSKDYISFRIEKARLNG